MSDLPLWLRSLRLSPDAWQDFEQWLSSQMGNAYRDERSTTSWDATQHARGCIKAWEDVDRLRRRALEEEKPDARRRPSTRAA